MCRVGGVGAANTSWAAEARAVHGALSRAEAVGVTEAGGALFEENLHGGREDCCME